MNQLINLGWYNICDKLYETYYKTINNYTICVAKHIDGNNWMVSIQTEEEIIEINKNASLKWVIKLADLLQLGS